MYNVHVHVNVYTVCTCSRVHAGAIIGIQFNRMGMELTENDGCLEADGLELEPVLLHVT